jgi:hypothetical protein
LLLLMVPQQETKFVGMEQNKMEEYMNHS